MKLGVVPDILTSAKGIGGGFPIGVMLTTEAIAKSFGVGVHGSTYGGNALACAVAGAVMDVLVSAETKANVAARTAQMLAGMQAVNARHHIFNDIRASGLWFGLELVPVWHGRAKEFVKAAEQHGLMILVAGPNVIRLAPSLLITEADVALGLEKFEAVVSQLLAAEAAKAAPAKAAA
jgi:acetylornithine/N-succinyldiaminopimelate aminotransferase